MEVKSVLLLISIAIFQIFCYSYFSDDSRWLRDDSTSIAFGQSRIASKDDIRKIRSLNTDGETNRLTISLADESPNGSGFHTNGTSEPGFTTNISSSTIISHEKASDVNLPDSKFSDNSTLKKIEETSTEESILQQSSVSSTENIISTSPTSYPLEISSLTIVDGKEIDNNKTMKQNDIGQTPSITTDAVNANFSFSLDVETTTTKNSKSNIDSQLNNTDYNIYNPNMEPSAFGSESARIPNVTETSTKVSAETSNESITTSKFELESDKVQVPTSLDTMSNQTTISSDTESISNSVTENSTTTVQSISRSITEKNTTMTDTWQTVDPITSEVPENTTTAQPNSMTDLNETESYNQTTAQPITNPVTEQPSTQSYNGTTVDPITSTVTENISTQSYTQSTVDPIASTVTENTSTQSYIQSTVDPIASTMTENTSTQSYSGTTVDPITSTVTENTSTQSYTQSTVDPIASTMTENTSTQSYSGTTVDPITSTVTENISTQSYTQSTVDPIASTVTENTSTQSYSGTTVDPITSTVTENATMTVQSTTNSVTEQSSTQATSESIQPVTTIRPSTSQSITETSLTDFTTKETVSTTDGNTTPFTHSTYPTENETTSHIHQECDCHGDDLLLPQCKEICALSTNLSGFHINLAFFGLKIRMILSNRDYLICIGVFLGITLVLVGFVARMIQRRKRRRMIAQRNFEILYQDFGVQSEKTKKWLADFNYQSSIL